MSKPQQLLLFEPAPEESPKPVVEPLTGPREEPEPQPAVKRKLTRAEIRDEHVRFDEFAIWLKRNLEPHLTRPLEIRRMYGRTRFVAMKQEGQFIVLRIHRRFADAPESVRDALLGWLKGPRRKPPKLVQQYIHELTTLAATEQRLQPPRLDLKTKGTVHDLDDIYHEVNETYFGGTCRVAIGWGHFFRKNARTRHLGSYSAALHRIQIHPLLDSLDVPRFVVAFVVFHELLHSRQAPGTRHPHDEQFRQSEITHPDHRRVKEWERTVFGKARQ